MIFGGKNTFTHKVGKDIPKSGYFPLFPFNSSNRTDTTIPNVVEGIGSHVIHGETMLIGTDLHESTKILNGDPFIWHNVKSIVISNNITKIGTNAFSNCKLLTNITIPDSVTEIGNHAFSGCSSITNITIPDSVTEIGE